MNELIEALEKLTNELHKGRKLNIKKDFSLLVADAEARKVLAKYKDEKSTTSKWLGGFVIEEDIA